MGRKIVNAGGGARDEAEYRGTWLSQWWEWGSWGWNYNPYPPTGVWGTVSSTQMPNDFPQLHLLILILSM